MPSIAPEGQSLHDRRIHVAAGVVRDAVGRILIARRAAHVHQGRLWEFPGGKVEPSESAYQALVRELHEELHIDVDVARPLIRIPYDYPDKAVLLDVWLVEQFHGRAVGREGQPIRWVAGDELPRFAFPAANRAIVNAARLPELYLITGAFADVTDFERRLSRALMAGVKLVQLRAGRLDDLAYATLAEVAVGICRVYGARLLLNAAPGMVNQVGADGIHLNGERLWACHERPLGRDQWVAASVHNAEELLQAQRLGVDFVVAGPVRTTASHPDASPIGWDGLHRLTELAPFPVYALGGVAPENLGEAFGRGAQGVAAISALWVPEASENG